MAGMFGFSLIFFSTLKITFDCFSSHPLQLVANTKAEKPWSKPIEVIEEEAKQPVEESDSESSETEVEEVRIINEIEEETDGQQVQQESTQEKPEEEEEEEPETPADVVVESQT